MKKLFLSLIVIMVVITSACAQKLDFGAKVGANLTKIDGVKFKNGYELSYHAGVFFEFDFNKKWGIQPEILFSQTTSKIDSGFSTIYQEAAGQLLKKDVKLNYLTIPVLLRINAGSLLTFNVGPQFGILMNNNENLWNNGKAAFKSGDFSAVVGAQINISRIRIYGRYNIGLYNVNDLGDSHKWKNQQLQLGVGIKIL